MAQADGVHVGQAMPPAKRPAGFSVPKNRRRVRADGREIRPLRRRMPAPTTSAWGAVQNQATKPEAVTFAFATLSDICRSVDIPVVAIGGPERKRP